MGTIFPLIHRVSTVGARHRTIRWFVIIATAKRLLREKIDEMDSVEIRNQRIKAICDAAQNLRIALHRAVHNNRDEIHYYIAEDRNRPYYSANRLQYAVDRLKEKQTTGRG